MDQTNVLRNSQRTSDAVTISGIDTAVPISIVGGAYSIGCTGTFVTTAGTINNRQTVATNKDLALSRPTPLSCACTAVWRKQRS